MATPGFFSTYYFPNYYTATFRATQCGYAAAYCGIVPVAAGMVAGRKRTGPRTGRIPPYIL